MKETARIINLKTRLAQTQTELQEAYAEAARGESATTRSRRSAAR